ncbi:hypothetical protein NW762_013697 [Fusarium torreyae]|uniref:Apple domain-containing protein n=1 Tax=Fusarium torreyae TaxID=1237075 RepID=A0A9W8RLS0_9HYPO|nr:hypothetical protein NW762_013697 [Fusarium torreyae]
MIFSHNLAFFALTSFFLSISSAAPNRDLPLISRRDDSSPAINSTASDGNNTTLEPVVPPAVDPRDLSILALDTKVVLAWAGSPSSQPGSRRMRKRDDGIFSQANFTFRYPVIPLDHSTYVTDVSCSKGSLTGTISSTTAYNYAKAQWKGAGKILFITSVDGCGDDHSNDLFLSRSITFSDSTKTFTAQGSSSDYGDVYERFSLKWGALGTLNVRRAIDKRAMFEPHALDKRLSGTWTLEWSRYLNDDDLLGTDDSAPWENAALLASWGKDGGEEDDSYAKGEVSDPNGHHKRWSNTTLAERDLTYGLALYCIECGFSGSASLTGTIEASIFDGMEVAQAQFNAQFKAGLNLGLAAFVKYEKTWEKDLADLQLPGFGISGLCSINPYIGLGVEAGLGIEATGTLLIGASVEWDNIDILIDMLDDDNSHSNGLVPVFKHMNEAHGELKVEAHLGLPISLGISLNVLFGLWEAKAGIKDTPSVVLEGSFEINAEVTDDGEILTDVEGDCYGIAWNIHFENTLDGFVDVDGFDPLEFPLLDPQESDPIAEGCIGYVNDGTDEDGGSGSGDDTGFAGNGMNAGGTGMNGFRAGSNPVPDLDLDPASTKKTGTKSNQKSTNQEGSTQNNKSKSSGKGAGSSSSDAKKSGSSNKKIKASTTSKTSTTTKTRAASSTTTGTASKQRTATKPTKSSGSKPTTTIKNVEPVKNNKQMKSTATKATNTAKKSTPSCTPSAIAKSKTPSGSTCKRTVTKPKVPSKLVISTTSSVKNVNVCATSCSQNSQCASFSYNEEKSCKLYSKSFRGLGVTSGKGQSTSTFYDKKCFTYKTCSK